VPQDSIRSAHWRARFRAEGRNRRIGLVWAAGLRPPYHLAQPRSIPLTVLTPLCEVDAQFYSLQSATISPAGVIYFADTFNQIVRVGAYSPIFTQQPASASILANQSTSFSTRC